VDRVECDEIGTVLTCINGDFSCCLYVFFSALILLMGINLWMGRLSTCSNYQSF